MLFVTIQTILLLQNVDSDTEGRYNWTVYKQLEHKQAFAGKYAVRRNVEMNVGDLNWTFLIADAGDCGWQSRWDDGSTRLVVSGASRT